MCRNINRPLSNSTADPGHHALIPGRSSEILLCAGAVHGVRLKVRYSIITVMSKGIKRQAELYVRALRDDDITAVLHGEDDMEARVSPFFCAVGEYDYFYPLKTLIANTLLGWELSDWANTFQWNLASAEV